MLIKNERVRVTRWDFAKPEDCAVSHQHAYDYVVVPLFGGDLRIDDGSDLEACFGDVEVAKPSGPAEREERCDGGGDGGALKRRAKLAGAVLRLGHSKEDRRVPMGWITTKFMIKALMKLSSMTQLYAEVASCFQCGKMT